jgi:hypothetical protein
VCDGEDEDGSDNDKVADASVVCDGEDENDSDDDSVVGAHTSAISDGDGRNDGSEAVNGESETDDGDSETGDDDKKETFKEDLKSWIIAADAQGLSRSCNSEFERDCIFILLCI